MRVALGDLHTVYVQHRHLAKGHGLANIGKLGEGEAVVFKCHAANGQCQANGLGAAAVKVEVGEFEFGPWCVSVWVKLQMPYSVG
jgi:hypothetical protein